MVCFSPVRFGIKLTFRALALHRSRVYHLFQPHIRQLIRAFRFGFVQKRKSILDITHDRDLLLWDKINIALEGIRDCKNYCPKT